MLGEICIIFLTTIMCWHGPRDLVLILISDFIKYPLLLYLTFIQSSIFSFCQDIRVRTRIAHDSDFTRICNKIRFSLKFHLNFCPFDCVFMLPFLLLKKGIVGIVCVENIHSSPPPHPPGAQAQMFLTVLDC